ncbi:MAG: DUF4268 domain-containing protein [Thermoplasmata archaeon]
MSVEKPEYVALRKMWNKEIAFSGWLKDNINILGERIGLSLEGAEDEQPVGSFSVDITAEESGRLVAIECQFDRANHDHLGKLLTYLTNLDAKIGIWICEDPKLEHMRAVNWLNEVSPDDVSFYLVKVEGFRIGDSSPAPLFTVVCSPTEETRRIGERKKDLAESQRKRLEFWRKLLERSRERTRLFENISPGKDHWIGTGAGTYGLAYNYVITKNRGRVELYIDKGDKDTNKAMFDELKSKKEQIESEFGGPLDWQRLDDRRASRICKDFHYAGLADESKWGKLQDDMIDAMIKLEKSMRRHISRLRR